MTTVLLVGDHARAWLEVRAVFRERDEYTVIEAESGEVALTLVASKKPSLVVLDLDLPGMDGLEMLHRLRSFSRVPVIVLTVRDNLDDKVTALDGGADDYLVEPVASEELLARARANIRRCDAAMHDDAILRSGPLEINLLYRTVTCDGERVSLTAREFRLLEMLVGNRGRLLMREELLETLWGHDKRDAHMRLRVTMTHLRRKLGDDAGNPKLIFTEPGLGYRWGLEDDPGDDL